MATIAARPDDLGGPPPGHPRGLYVLFGSEMWERFSYYGMRALLVLYLTDHLKYARKDALNVYAIYTGLVYATPLVGGYFADKFLGQRKAVVIGGIIFAVGHFAMAFESMLLTALTLLIVGNGFFKPNISTMVGKLYDQDDPRKDGAYTIFYMGINIGATVSPLVCGALGEKVGWHYGFAAAGVGMVLGLITFISFQSYLGSKGLPPGREAGGGPTNLTTRDWVDIVIWSAAWIGAVVAALAYSPQMRAIWAPEKVVAWFPTGADLALLGYRSALGLGLASILYLGFSQVAGARASDAEGLSTEPEPLEAPGVQAQRVAVIVIIALFSIVFWMGFEQAGGTVNLFTKDKIDRKLFGYEVPTSWFQAMNGIMIVALAPVFSVIWVALDKTRFKVPSSAKMGLGMIVMGLGFVVMTFADHSAARVGRVSMAWVTAYYLLATIGELCLSPIGLSLVNKLAPAKIASLMMAVWFVCTAVANYLAGKLESYIEGRFELYPFIVAVSVVSGLLVLLLTPALKKMSHGRL